MVCLSSFSLPPVRGSLSDFPSAPQFFLPSFAACQKCDGWFRRTPPWSWSWAWEVSLGVRILTNSCWVCGLSVPQREALVPRHLPLTFWKGDQSRGLVCGPGGIDSLWPGSAFKLLALCHLPFLSGISLHLPLKGALFSVIRVEEKGVKR